MGSIPTSGQRGVCRTGEGSEGRACPEEEATHPEKVVKALGVPTELGQVVHEAVTLLIGEQVHQVAGIHSCKGTPPLWVVLHFLHPMGGVRALRVCAAGGAEGCRMGTALPECLWGGRGLYQ